MIVVFLSSLALAAFDQYVRMDNLQLKRMREGSMLLVPFLVMVALKLGLVLAMKAHRSPPANATWPDPIERPLS
jgi:hypothetical protein